MKADDGEKSITIDEALAVKFEEYEEKPMFLQVPDSGLGYMIKGILQENEQLKTQVQTLMANEAKTREKASLLSEEFAHLREIRIGICQKYDDLSTEYKNLSDSHESLQMKYNALSTEHNTLNQEFHEEKKILLVENNQLKRKLSCMHDERKVLKSKVSRITKESVDLRTMLDKEWPNIFLKKTWSTVDLSL